MIADDLLQSISAIEGALQRLDRMVLLRSLRPGLPARAVPAALVDAGLTAPPELVALYAWRNGTSTGGVTLDDIHLFPGFYLLSVEDSVANYRSFVMDSRWRAGWLPIFANGGGDFYVLDLRSAPGRPMRHFRIEESEHPVEFRSLGAMLATLSAAFERGIFFVDRYGYLEMDDAAFAELAAESNPDVGWWHE